MPRKNHRDDDRSKKPRYADDNQHSQRGANNQHSANTEHGANSGHNAPANHSSTLTPFVMPDLRDRARLEMAANGLRAAFSPESSAQVQKVLQTYQGGQGLGKFTISGKTKDLKHLLWSSVDNKESKDLDQIEYAEKLPDGRARVMIGIADVDAFVPKGSPVDKEASDNTTSVYTGVINFPMLPDKLSEDLTSLLPDEERLAMVYDLIFTDQGQVVESHVYPAIVINKAKLDYKTIGDWLEGNTGVPREVKRVQGLTEQLLLQAKIKENILNLRQKRGSLFLRTVEARAVSSDGQVLDLEIVEDNPARELIENLMVAANVAVSAYLDKKNFPSIKRVVRTPENWPKIVELARTYHENLPDSPDARALQGFLLKMRDKDALRFPDLSLRVVKLLGKGEYVLDPPGENAPIHFALAVNDYTHSTAPNRRYIDLVTQRLLKAAMAGQPCPYTEDELAEIAQRCTKQSGIAKKVERTMRKIAAAALLAKQIGRVYDGIITGVKGNNVFVRTIRPPVEGMITQGARGLEVGDEVRVKLLHVDAANAHIDFAVEH